MSFLVKPLNFEYVEENRAIDDTCGSDWCACDDLSCGCDDLSCGCDDFSVY